MDNEIEKLLVYVQAHGYDYEIYNIPARNRYQIVVFNEHGQREWDVVCQPGSIGYEQGLLEIYGKIVGEHKNAFDAVVGNLTADEVIERIKRYEATKKH